MISGTASPCSRSVSPTAATAASGTGFSFGTGGLRVFDGSVVSARRASLAAALMLPSGYRISRSAVFAFWIAPRDSPTWAAYWRSLMPCIGGSDLSFKIMCLSS